jgi:hypothetical protein
MAADRRTTWVAVALVVALVVIIVAQTTNTPPPTAQQPTRGRTGIPAGEPADQSLIDVNLEALQRERGEPAGPGRNPFQFQAKPAPVVALPPPVTRPSNQSAAVPIGPPRPLGPPPPPPIPLKFLGAVGKLENGQIKQIALLSDGRGIIYGQEGQTVAGQYVILKIGVESIEMAYSDGRGRQTIPMSGDK